MKDPKYQQQLVDMIRLCAPDLRVQWDDNRTIPAHTNLSALLTAFRAVHTVWTTRTYLTDAQVQMYNNHVSNMRSAWLAFGWKVTPWVHWVLSHSATIIAEQRNMYIMYP